MYIFLSLIKINENDLALLSFFNVIFRKMLCDQVCSSNNPQLKHKLNLAFVHNENKHGFFYAMYCAKMCLSMNIIHFIHCDFHYYFFVIVFAYEMFSFCQCMQLDVKSRKSTKPKLSLTLLDWMCDPFVHCKCT